MKLLKTFLFFAVLLVFACQDGGSKKSYLPESIGPINSLVVVMDNQLWKGEVGDKVRAYFAAPEVGLIWEEPLFSINYFPTTNVQRGYETISFNPLCAERHLGRGSPKDRYVCHPARGRCDQRAHE